MSDLDKAFNSLAGDATNSLKAANELYRQSLEEAHRRLIMDRIWETIIFIAGCVVIYKVVKWSQNVESHLKKISNADQQSDGIPTSQKPKAVECSAASNQEAKMQSQPLPNPNRQQQTAKEQSVAADSSAHPHSRYMPKS